MISTTMARATDAASPIAAPFERLAGLCALLTGAAGFVYAVAFVLLKNDALAAAMLAFSGLLTTAVYVALYERLRAVDPPLALWGLVLGLSSAVGALIHGGYDLANALHPPATPNRDLPNPVDPRGLLVFGIAGIALLIIAALIRRSRAFPKGLAALGTLAAALLLILYLGRLIILDAGHPVIVVAALLSGFLITPAWNVWLGAALLRGRAA